MKYTPHIEALTNLQLDLSKERNDLIFDVEKILDMECKILGLLSELYCMRQTNYDKACHRSRDSNFSIVDF